VELVAELTTVIAQLQILMTNDCTDKSVGVACKTTSGVSGSCHLLSSGGANSECDCRTGGGGGSPLPSSSPGGQCAQALASCSINGDGSSTCCAGLVCQNGVNGSARCEDPGTADVCPGGGVCGGANGWIGFKCNQLSSGECHDNDQTFGSYGAAAAYAGSCGQADEVCVGGTKNRQLCGDFTIFSSGCGSGGNQGSPNPSVPPSGEPTPHPTPNPTPGVTPSPVASPTPGVTPSPVASPTPGVTPSPSPIPPVCGGACSFTSECPQDHTCNNGKCELTACVNGASCSSDNCRVTACASTCSFTSECPQDHVCNNGKCELSACVSGGSTCTSDRCRITGCTSSCSNNSECPNDHTCNNSKCELTVCVNGANCDSNRCYVINNPTPVPTPSPVVVVGCNDPCVNNSDCRSQDQICVDTVTGKRCRYEQNITSESCSGQVVAQASPQPQATVLPTAGSNDIVMAVGAGAAAIILGIVGFLML
jgi:hypothetical protein